MSATLNSSAREFSGCSAGLSFYVVRLAGGIAPALRSVLAVARRRRRGRVASRKPLGAVLSHVIDERDEVLPHGGEGILHARWNLGVGRAGDDTRLLQTLSLSESVVGLIPESERLSVLNRFMPLLRSRRTRSVHLPEMMLAVRSTGQDCDVLPAGCDTLNLLFVFGRSRAVSYTHLTLPTILRV